MILSFKKKKPKQMETPGLEPLPDENFKPKGFDIVKKGIMWKIHDHHFIQYRETIPNSIDYFHQSHATRRKWRMSDVEHKIGTRIEAGDILFFESNNNKLGSKFVKYFTNSKITHVAVAITVGELSTYDTADFDDPIALVQKKVLLWEVGANSMQAKSLAKENSHPAMSVRFTDFDEIYNVRKTNIFVRKLEPDPVFFDDAQMHYVDHASRKLFLKKFLDYGVDKFGCEYDQKIPDMWLGKDGIFPINYNVDETGKKIRGGTPMQRNPINCSMLVHDTLSYAGIFKDQLNPYYITPGELFEHAQIMCNPSVTYGPPIQIK